MHGQLYVNISGDINTCPMMNAIYCWKILEIQEELLLRLIQKKSEVSANEQK